MNVFFGKISPKNIEQIEGTFYKAPKDWSGFGGLQPSDYVFMLCKGKVHLWKATSYDETVGVFRFDSIIPNLGDCTAFLAHIKYFKLSMELAVKTHRQTKGMAFFKMDAESTFTEEMLISSATYTDPGTFRKIFVRNNESEVVPNSYDVQFYFDDGQLRIATFENFDESYYSTFRDNLPFIGNGRPKKDKILAIVKETSKRNLGFDYNSEFDLLKAYDALMVDYNAKEEPEEDEAEIIQATPQARFWCFKHKWKDATTDNVNELIDWAFANNSCKMQQEYGIQDQEKVTKNWNMAKQIHVGDYVFLRGNSDVYAFGKVCKPRKNCTKSGISAESIISSKSMMGVSSRECSDVIHFTDTDAFYEDLTEGPEMWGQRIDVEQWIPSQKNQPQKSISKDNYLTKEEFLTIKEMSFVAAKKFMKVWGYELQVVDKKLDEQTKLLKLKKNVILQGAPGTGKTYNTAALALSVIGKLPPQGSETEKEYHEKVMSEYEKLLIKFDDKGNIVGEGQIGFVTFHQSMDYEDFVEGIKPITDKTAKSISYEVPPGIFKRVVEEAKFAYVNQTTDDFSAAEEFDVLWTMLVDDANEKQAASPKIGYETKSKSMMYVDFADENSIVMLGEGATTTTTIYKSEMLKLWNVFADAELEKIENFNKEFRKYVGGNETAKYALLKYMQSIRGKSSKQLKGNVLSVENKKELVGKLLKEDFKKTDVKNYVLIIDEINRGNVSKIFGELISLLEADKRDGGDHPLSVTLPYSKEKFSVPSNLYIIGTMNTTDRSVGSIDYAVRRRFAFVTLEADESLVPKGDARDLFNAVKNFIEKSKYDMDIEDLMVGHSYFMDSANLQMKWQYEILPLLMEYHKDGIISKSPLKDAADKDIADVKKKYANFTAAWKKPDSDTPNS